MHRCLEKNTASHVSYLSVASHQCIHAVEQQQTCTQNLTFFPSDSLRNTCESAASSGLKSPLICTHLKVLSVWQVPHVHSELIPWDGRHLAVSANK